MGLFESLQTGGRGQRGGQTLRPEAQRERQEFDDFIQRYEQGAPWESVSDREALERYQQVAPHASPEVYQDAAREAFERLSPQQRAEFGQYLRQQARRQNIEVPDLNQDGIDDRLQDPATLARVTSRIHEQEPGTFDQLLGGRGADVANALNNPLAKAALAGIAAMAAKRILSGR